MDAKFIEVWMDFPNDLRLPDGEDDFPVKVGSFYKLWESVQRYVYNDIVFLTFGL
jgi:hypothetical protein